MSILKRYFIELTFNGSKYHGWQKQENAISVQQVLNNAMSTLLRQDVETLGCGRTDSGVHATQLFAHFDAMAELDENKFLKSLNSLLPYDIAVNRLIPVHPEAHARFDAVKRSYQYQVHFKKDPFKQGFSWLLRDVPDIQKMNRAAAILKEYRDFSCFSKSNTQTFTNNCVITRAEWESNGSSLVFHISADRFLRNMVRAIVGTLISIGRNEINEDDLRKIIESKNRSKAGASVPACGLYLTEVVYPYI
ncbi:tRNA pseudouridine(38-40) synthase TruA [Daejeonella oryzae]|uniref:tRNA pseudouridine(38-40) synthase TruA n=1 Tax=Daejeonella oryzae TaxID=1122943 RepID=UPI00040CEB04|nr:tRNA pseudouridine(38-40) synthase TruA [Daejeonella oryzae]